MCSTWVSAGLHTAASTLHVGEQDRSEQEHFTSMYIYYTLKSYRQHSDPCIKYTAKALLYEHLYKWLLPAVWQGLGLNLAQVTKDFSLTGNAVTVSLEQGDGYV